MDPRSGRRDSSPAPPEAVPQPTSPLFFLTNQTLMEKEQNNSAPNAKEVYDEQIVDSC
jgi:hypothetical protein